MPKTLEAPTPIGLRLIAWPAAVSAGLVGGFVLLLLEVALSPLLSEATAWHALQRSAALALGRAAFAAEPGIYVLLLGLILHFAVAALWAAVLAVLLALWHLGDRQWSATVGLVLGALFGFVVYVVQFYALTPWWPWLGAERDALTTVHYLAFGAVTALAYEWLARPWRKRAAPRERY